MPASSSHNTTSLSARRFLIRQLSALNRHVFARSNHRQPTVGFGRLRFAEITRKAVLIIDPCALTPVTRVLVSASASISRVQVKRRQLKSDANAATTCI